MRSKPNLTLTPEGEALAAAVASGMATIRTTVQALIAPGAAARPGDQHLHRFCQLLFDVATRAISAPAIPEVEVELVTRDQNRAYSPNQCDLVIYFGGGALPRCGSSAEVFGEELIAVCGSDYLPDGRTLSLAELVEERLAFSQ